ncbi:MFS transporter [Desulfotruncus alcoholivorax]|uniref:MFS transporter n=1 Tax=Desulfotruncus alcoholivorax TaxID=265477 RepID=UPI000429E2EF|nr:MFS transporter [Desulfotruncus alcoholivorax]
MEVNSVVLVTCVNFLLNIAIQGSTIFIPLLGARLGASDFQVGLIGAAYGGAYLLSSLYFGRQSDRRGRTAFVRSGLVLCIIAFAAQLLAHNLYILTLVRAGVGFALGVTMAALMAYAYESGADMGRFSSYGSLGWIAGALGAAWLKDFDILFLASAVCCLVAFSFSLFFSSATGPGVGGNKKEAASFREVVKVGFPIYLAVFLRHLGAAAVWIILPLYFATLGLDRFWVGILWGINFAVQFVVMRYLERFDPNKIFAFGQVLSIIVFVAYVLASKLTTLIAVQLLLGVAWSCLYVGALLLVLRAGEDRGTASGIFQATLNLCSALGPLLGGIIAQYTGYHGVMLFAAALGVAGLVVAVPRPGRTQVKMN